MTSKNEISQTTTNEQPRYLTKAELARRLRKSQRTVENWQRRGFIPYVKLGRSVLFKWEDVEHHLDAHFRVCSSPPRPPLSPTPQSADDLLPTPQKSPPTQ